jgi:hypothetical protein
MKKIIIVVALLLTLLSCKDVFKGNNTGSFSLTNYSNKVIEFVWVAPEGDFYPTSKNVSIGYGQSYDLSGMSVGIYDIAIDFKNEFNSFNSKKDKSLCLTIEKDIKKNWIVNSAGEIIRN